ncbi:hypothetical protein B0W47_14680 [Komagataeibacter nataicola]|uniref:Uncharacterized protein n=1 Tax=Komagataeibacter nataicola TaxID=265960 RepID=A0A9N7H1Y2_9PROT|nr:hypothetical protein B0W47_14680 [Komagataeibacter nataicola]PYD67194.1 hypothetical protein CDI09_04485 [Komagataeibacter nataicola]
MSLIKRKKIFLGVAFVQAGFSAPALFEKSFTKTFYNFRVLLRPVLLNKWELQNFMFLINLFFSGGRAVALRHSK